MNNSAPPPEENREEGESVTGSIVEDIFAEDSEMEELPEAPVRPPPSVAETMDDMMQRQLQSEAGLLTPDFPSQDCRDPPSPSPTGSSSLAAELQPTPADARSHSGDG